MNSQTVEATKESFEGSIEPVLHHQVYRAPNIRRAYIPKPDKTEGPLPGAKRSMLPKRVLPNYCA